MSLEKSAEERPPVGANFLQHLKSLQPAQIPLPQMLVEFYPLQDQMFGEGHVQSFQQHFFIVLRPITHTFEPHSEVVLEDQLILTVGSTRHEG